MPGERAVCILTAGNLATTQAVIRQVRRDLEKKSGASLNRFDELPEAAEYIGKLSRSEQGKHQSKGKDAFNPEDIFIVGGQVGKRPSL